MSGHRFDVRTRCVFLAKCEEPRIAQSKNMTKCEQFSLKNYDWNLMRPCKP